MGVWAGDAGTAQGDPTKRSRGADLLPRFDPAFRCRQRRSRFARKQIIAARLCIAAGALQALPNGAELVQQAVPATQQPRHPPLARRTASILRGTRTRQSARQAPDVPARVRSTRPSRPAGPRSFDADDHAKAEAVSARSSLLVRRQRSYETEAAASAEGSHADEADVSEGWLSERLLGSGESLSGDGRRVADGEPSANGSGGVASAGLPVARGGLAAGSPRTSGSDSGC